MVGNTSISTETTLGRLLAPYLSDPSTAFVISSDFAHWGTRFRYTFYRPASGPSQQLSSSAKAPRDPPIHESIKQVDFDCMGACESGSHMAWLESLEGTYYVLPTSGVGDVCFGVGGLTCCTRERQHCLRSSPYRRYHGCDRGSAQAGW